MFWTKLAVRLHHPNKKSSAQAKAYIVHIVKWTQSQKQTKTQNFSLFMAYQKFLCAEKKRELENVQSSSWNLFEATSPATNNNTSIKCLEK